MESSIKERCITSSLFMLIYLFFINLHIYFNAAEFGGKVCQVHAVLYGNCFDAFLIEN
jgi:hypothetical protein